MAGTVKESLFGMLVRAAGVSRGPDTVLASDESTTTPEPEISAVPSAPEKPPSLLEKARASEAAAFEENEKWRVEEAKNIRRGVAEAAAAILETKIRPQDLEPFQSAEDLKRRSLPRVFFFSVDGIDFQANYRSAYNSSKGPANIDLYYVPKGINGGPKRQIYRLVDLLQWVKDD